jgi:hypothetical protein
VSDSAIIITEKNAREAPEIMKRFKAEFAAGEVKVKPAVVRGTRCLALHYLDSRLVMDRLDDVVGVAGWQDQYTLLPGGEVECRLSVRIGGEWVTKVDVGGQSEQPDEGDRMKAAYSDALKRAAVKFGIGRYLYRLPQQWMDYDPQTKQIKRPAPAASNSATKPQEQQAAAPAKTKAPTLDQIKQSVASAEPPKSAAELNDRVDWLCRNLRKQLPEFVPADLTESISDALGLSDEWLVTTLAPGQVGPAWAAVKNYVAGCAAPKPESQPAGVA